jgi:hypothetical protein
LLLPVSGLNAQEVMPAYPIPARPLLFELDTPSPAADLAGLDLTQAERRLVDTSPRLEEGLPLNVRLYWECRRKVAEAEVHLRIEGAGPTFHAAHKIVTTNWQTGGVYLASYELPLPRLRYSGKAALRISIEAEEGEQTLYALPVFITPTGAPSPVKAQEIQAFFGDHAQSIGKSVRLGPGALLKFPVTAKNLNRIGLVSAVHHDPTLKQDEPVALLRCYHADEVVAEVSVVAGVSTAAANYNFYRPGYIDAEPIEIFSTRPAGGKNAEGEDYEILSYGAWLSLLKAVEVDTLEIEYLRDTGLLEVLDVVY